MAQSQMVEFKMATMIELKQRLSLISLSLFQSLLVVGISVVVMYL